MRKIVGLTGKLGSGKDTVASFLMDHGWQRIAFADKLYQEVSLAFNVPVSRLQDRATKETPMPALALCNCTDNLFIGVVLEAGSKSQPDGLYTQKSLIATLSEPQSPRRILQLWGTEYRRRLFGDSYWRDKVQHVLEQHPEVNFVITDVRFPDEGRLVESLGGVVARVVRPEQAHAVDARTQHPSETAMDEYPVTLTLINEEGTAGLARLRDQVIGYFVEEASATPQLAVA